MFHAILIDTITRMRAANVLALSIVALQYNLTGSYAFAVDAESVYVENKFGYPLYLWISPRGTGQWSKPVPYMANNTRIRLRLSSPGDYFLLARDTANNDDTIVYVDLHSIVTLSPSAIIVVSGEYQNVQEEYEYSVTVMSPEERTSTTKVSKNVPRQETYTYMVRVWRNGRYVDEERTGTKTVYDTVWEDVTKTYTVMVPHTETKTATRNVVKPRVKLLIREGSTERSLDTFLKANNISPNLSP